MRNPKGILAVIEYLDPTGQEIVHRVPEEGSGEIVLGSQCIVRENQAAIFFRDGRALDMLGPGRHTLTTLNIPLLINYLKIPFGSQSPFKAEVVFVNLKDYLGLTWRTPQAVAFRDPEFGVIRLGAEGQFSFQVSRPQLFVNQVVGTRGLYRSDDILGYARSILSSRFTDLLGQLQASVLDLPAKYEELGAGLRAKAAEDLEAIGLLLKAVYISSITVPPEVEKSIDERASMGAIGSMQAYLQFKAARAMGDAAKAGGGAAGSVAGLGVGLGAGMGLGTTMAQVIGEAMKSGVQAPVVTRAPTLLELFATLKQVVSQQAALSEEDRRAAHAGLDALLTLLSSATATLAELSAARGPLLSRFPWLGEPLRAVLSTEAGLKALGQIALRSM